MGHSAIVGDADYPPEYYNRAVYSPALLDHFQHPRNPGEIPSPDASVRLENPACGDVLQLALKLDGDCIGEIRFKAKGCVPAMACGSAITELVKGKTIDQARSVSREDLIRCVAGVPEASTHAIHLALDTLRALLQDI